MYPLPRRALRHHPGASYGIGDRRQKRPIERGRGRSTWARVARLIPARSNMSYSLCATSLKKVIQTKRHRMIVPKFRTASLPTRVLVQYRSRRSMSSTTGKEENVWDYPRSVSLGRVGDERHQADSWLSLRPPALEKTDRYAVLHAPTEHFLSAHLVHLAIFG
jgi:hypothetical protein